MPAHCSANEGRSAVSSKTQRKRRQDGPREPRGNAVIGRAEGRHFEVLGIQQAKAAVPALERRHRRRASTSG
jgi:hypothetical protein